MEPEFDQKRVVRVLSLDGGGYLGLATAAFIRGIEAHFRVSFHGRFDLFCGTSTGAILALGLASGRSGEELVALYKQLGPRVFRNPRPRWFVGPLRKLQGCLLSAKYHNEPLRKALTDQFGALTLNDVRQKGKAALITAFNVTSGYPRLFKTDHSPNLTRDGELELVDIALASSAAPTYFPLAEITNPQDRVTESFCDGGVVANHPALLGFAEALSELGAKPANVRILSLSTPRKNLGESGSSRPPLDRSLWGWRKSLAEILTDSNSIMAHELLRRIVESYPLAERPLYERLHMPNAHSLEMDCATDANTKDLESLGASQAGSNETRDRLKPIILEESGNG